MTRILIGAAMVLALIIGFTLGSQKKGEVVENMKPVVAEDVEKTDSAQKTESEDGETSVVSSNKVLDLSNSGLEKVPSYVYTKTDIQELNVSNNNLTGSLQAEIRNLQNLKVLNLSNNQFTGVPAEIGQLKNLEVLDLSNNKLTGLPYELGNLTNLKVLKLAGNAYSEADLAIIKKTLPDSVVIVVE